MSPLSSLTLCKGQDQNQPLYLCDEKTQKAAKTLETNAIHCSHSYQEVDSRSEAILQALIRIDITMV